MKSLEISLFAVLTATSAYAGGSGSIFLTDPSVELGGDMAPSFELGGEFSSFTPYSAITADFYRNIGKSPIRLTNGNFQDVSKELENKRFKLKYLDSAKSFVKVEESENKLLLEADDGKLATIEKVEDPALETAGELSIEESEVAIEVLD